MGDYFKPWRRKLGVLTLVLACLFMAAWVRSLAVRDTYLFQQEQRKGAEPFGHLSFISSNDGRLKWVQWDAKNESATFMMVLDGSYFNGKSGKLDTFDNLTSECRIRFCGLEFWNGTYRKSELNVAMFVLPYGFPVFPLTLLSTWLLLSKPRESTQKRITESILEKVG